MPEVKNGEAMPRRLYCSTMSPAKIAMTFSQHDISSRHAMMDRLTKTGPCKSSHDVEAVCDAYD